MTALDPGSVEPRLAGRLGRPYVWREECTSTQDLLRGSSLPEGAVAVTEHQTAGRGRAGRGWTDEPGSSLLVSVLLRPAMPAARLPQLSLVAGLAVAEAIEAAAGIGCGLKWPNDVVYDDRKLAGILLETADDALVCGIGVNVDQDAAHLPPRGRLASISLRVATGRTHDRASLLVHLLARLEARYDEWLAEGLTAALEALDARDWARGRTVVTASGTGVADGIDADGRLRVLVDDDVVLVTSGEVDVEPAG